MKKKTFAAVGLSMALGGGIGLAVESHINEAAEGRAHTAEVCIERYPHEKTLTQDIVKCFESGTPGGNEIDKDTFHEGDPVALAESYIQVQRSEATHTELGRIAVWTLLPLVIGAGAPFFLDRLMTS